MKGETEIQYIEDKLDQGKDRASILSPFCKKFQVTDRTFDKYWKIANDRHTDKISKVKEVRDAALVDSEKKAALKGLNDKFHYVEILTGNIKRLQEIKAGKTIRVKFSETGKQTDDLMITASYRDEIAAIAEQKGHIQEIAKLLNLYEDTGDGKTVVVNIDLSKVNLISDKIT